MELRKDDEDDYEEKRREKKLTPFSKSLSDYYSFCFLLASNNHARSLARSLSDVLFKLQHYERTKQHSSAQCSPKSKLNNRNECIEQKSFSSCFFSTNKIHFDSSKFASTGGWCTSSQTSPSSNPIIFIMEWMEERERVREWENFSLPSPQSGRRELKLNIDDSVREKRLAPNGSAPLRSHPLPSSFQLAPWAWSWLIAANLKLNASRHLCLFSSPLCSLACFLIIIHPSRLIELSFFLSSRIAVEMLLLKLVIWST